MKNSKIEIKGIKELIEEKNNLYDEIYRKKDMTFPLILIILPDIILLILVLNKIINDENNVVICGFLLIINIIFGVIASFLEKNQRRINIDKIVKEYKDNTLTNEIREIENKEKYWKFWDNRVNTEKSECLYKYIINKKYKNQNIKEKNESFTNELKSEIKEMLDSKKTLFKFNKINILMGILITILLTIKGNYVSVIFAKLHTRNYNIWGLTVWLILALILWFHICFPVLDIFCLAYNNNKTNNKIKIKKYNEIIEYLKKI